MQSLQRSIFPFSLRSPRAHGALTVRSLALPAPLRSRFPFTKHSPCSHCAFTKRSPCIHRSFSVHLLFSPISSFIFIPNSKMKGSVFASRNKVRKERMRKGERKLTCILQIKHHLNQNLIRKI